MRVKAELIDTINVANTLGEGVLWHCSESKTARRTAR